MLCVFWRREALRRIREHPAGYDPQLPRAKAVKRVRVFGCRRWCCDRLIGGLGGGGGLIGRSDTSGTAAWSVATSGMAFAWDAVA